MGILVVLNRMGNIQLCNDKKNRCNGVKNIFFFDEQ